VDEVRRLRLEKGWSQNELAYHAKLAPSVISLIETGKRDPNATTLRKLASALEVRIPDLFEESGSGKAQRRSSLQASFNDAIEDLRRTTDRFEGYHAIQKAVDEYRELWEKRLADGDFDKDALDEAGLALKAFWPAVTAAADAELVEGAQWGVQPEEAAAHSVLLPAIARFQALCERVNNTYREKYAPGAAVYAFPQREAS